MPVTGHHPPGPSQSIEIAPTALPALPRHAVGVTGGPGAERTRVVLLESENGRLPDIGWVGVDAPGVSDSGIAESASYYEGPRTSWDAWLVESSASVSPQHAEGYLGRPALLGFRPTHPNRGTAWSPLFADSVVVVTPAGLRVNAQDAAEELSFQYEIESLVGGSLRLRASVRNLGITTYVVEALDVVVPIAGAEIELLDFTGRWAFEKQPQRHLLGDGIWMREHRRGMRALDATSTIVAGNPGFGFGNGTVTGLHLAWSGNHRYGAERLSSGLTLLRAGELLLPGEVELGKDETYRTPWVHLTASEHGLDGLADATHRYLRSVATKTGPALVQFNAWEAVYFDHDLGVLSDLATIAAEVGVERFVLDDGWFQRRGDTSSGLGDWQPDADAWPNGLAPLAKHVHRLGMEFGLWWEPEAVNPDSDLFRAHPDWVLQLSHRKPELERDSYLLDLSNPDVHDHLTDVFESLTSSSSIDFIKWDHNRDLMDAGLTKTQGLAASRAQTLGFYRLLDQLRASHPDISWEMCASGGGRIDHSVLERVQGIWASDNTDPLSRQRIQPWTAQTVPLEYLGAHISASPSHQTGRATTLSFRAATAFMGAFGIQWDLRRASAAELDTITRWCALYKQHRDLLHTGTLHRVDLGPQLTALGVVAHDRSEAIYSYAQLDDQVHLPPRLRLTGLDPLAVYVVKRLDGDAATDWPVDGMSTTGGILATRGIPGPARRPQSAGIVHVRLAR